MSKYGFQAYLSQEFPSQIVIDVTEVCNLSCIHCPHEIFSKSDVSKGRHLPLSLHKKLIDEVAEDSNGYCKYLRYTGQGETLIHPHFIEMISYAGMVAGVPINITTNGTLLTENKAKTLLDAGVDVFDISIDAYTEETYARIRRKGDFNSVRQNVLRLISLIKNDKHKTKIVVSFVGQAYNKQESADFKKFWSEAGADYVVVRRLHSSAGFKKQLVEANNTRYPCLYPWERITLSPDGCIHFCPQDWMHSSVIGRFEDITIKEVWQGGFMEQLREAHLRNDFSHHPFCGQCPDWSTTRWPREGRAYSDMMQELVPLDLSDNKERE